MAIEYIALSSSANQISTGKNIFADDIRGIASTYNYAARYYPKQHLNLTFWGESSLDTAMAPALFATASSATYQRFVSTDIFVDRYEISGTFSMEANATTLSNIATGRLILSGSSGSITASLSRNNSQNGTYGSTSFDIRPIKTAGADEWIWVRFEGARSFGTGNVLFGGIQLTFDGAVSSSATFPVND